MHRSSAPAGESLPQKALRLEQVQGGRHLFEGWRSGTSSCRRQAAQIT
jgi:hypothetical protein